MSLAALDQKFLILDELPEALYSTVITLTHSDLITRVKGVLQWREALLQGLLPDEQVLDWPEPDMRRSILKRLEVLEIVQYCKDQIELTDSVLKDICEGISSAEEFYKHAPDGFVDKLAQRQQIRDRDSPFDDPEGLADHVENSRGSRNNSAENNESGNNQGNSRDQNESNGENNQDQSQQSFGQSSSEQSIQNRSGNGSEAGSENSQQSVGLEQNVSEEMLSPFPINDPTNGQIFSEEENGSIGSNKFDQNKNIPEEIQQSFVIKNDEQAADHLEERWSELADNWHELSETFSELSGLLGRGWDLTQGVLASQGWRDIIRYRKLIKQIPELKSLVKTLGRLKTISGDDKTDSVCEKIFNPIKRMVADEDETMTNCAVMEAGGIDRSDELSRMLPSELALLGHPKLKILWHAKRAERMLMTYSYSGLMPDVVEKEDEVELDGPPVEEKSSQGFGPIIVCLDTSGSMHGEPEQIAKALVLEALRIAWNEERPCYVYSFGGPEEILEHELDLTKGGLGKLLDFLQMSFHGGTDVTKPLLKALEKQYSENWEKADILLISDGRFPANIDLFSKIKKMKKKQDLRLHGLLLGDWKGRSIEQLCEPLHRFKDWQEMMEEQ